MPHLFQSGLFFGENAWHGLGTTLPADSPARFSIEESIRLAGLDWQVETQPVFCNGQEIAEHRAIVRSDTSEVLGVVGDRYHPLQNREQFDWFAPFLESGECTFETCGALKGGRIVWVLAKLQRDDAIVSADDRIRKFLLLSSSHDGSMATNIGFNPTRVVCWNTLSAALAAGRKGSNGASLIKIKHTKSQQQALAAIRETVNLMDETFEATAAQYRKLLASGVNRDDLRNYVKLVFEMESDESKLSTRQRNILDNVCNLAINGVGNDGKTAWSAYNGVTQYLTHEYGRNADSRLRANWYGEAKRVNDRALAVAMQLAA